MTKEEARAASVDRADEASCGGVLAAGPLVRSPGGRLEDAAERLRRVAAALDAMAEVEIEREQTP